MKIILISFFFTLFFVSTNAQNDFFKINDLKLGANYGYARYYGDYKSDLPEKVYYKPETKFWATPDIRYYQFFAEAENTQNFVLNLGLGYKEIWDLFYINVDEESEAALGIGGNIGYYFNTNLAFGYSLKYKGLELIPSIGIGGYFSSGISDYTTEVSLPDDSIEVNVITNQLKQHFFTIDSNIKLRYWMRRLGISLGLSYSQGMVKINETEGNFDWKGSKGKYSGQMNASHLTLDFGVAYRLFKGRARSADY